VFAAPVATAIVATTSLVLDPGYAGLTLQSRAGNAYADDWWLGPYPIGTPVYVCGYFEFGGIDSRFTAPPSWWPVVCGGSDSYQVEPLSACTNWGLLSPVTAGPTSPIGGGTTGGALAWGQYWPACTMIVAGTESGIGNTQGYDFTVYPGNIPRVPIRLQFGAASANVYLTMPLNIPTVQAAVDPIGGGTSGGQLAAGSYQASYTWVDPVTSIESGAGMSESSRFTVVSGYVPQITMSWIPWFPSFARANRAAVNPIGGGTTGGNLAPGKYYVTFSYVSPGGVETGVGDSESLPFSISAGNVPQITYIDLPTFNGGWSVNIYLTPPGGMRGSEVLYATGITSVTFNLAAAAPSGAPSPPAPPIFNVYLTPANGPAGSEVLYASGVATKTFLLSAAAPLGGSAPAATRGGPGDLVQYATGITAAGWNPSGPPSVDPTGGGASGGEMNQGYYTAEFTWVYANGIESGPSPASDQFYVYNILPGGQIETNIPRVALPSLPAGVTAMNLYLTSSLGGPSLYAGGITTSTYDLVAPFLGGGFGAAPPNPLAFCDCAALNTGTVAPPPGTPWL